MTDIFRTILNMSITGACIAAVLMLLRLCMKGLPRKYSYAMWSILWIRLLCPFSLSAAVSLFNAFRPQTTRNSMNYLPQSAPYTPPAETPLTTIPASPLPVPTETPQISVLPVPEAVSPLELLLFIGSVIWLIGAAVMILYNTAAYVSVRKRVSSATPFRDNILLCDSIETPFVYGIIKPKIYLPSTVSGTDLDFILAHEREHIRRGDHIAKLIALAALTLHWFNPMAWLSFKLMVRDMELSCDERAVLGFDKDVRKDYASALLNISMVQNKLADSRASFSCGGLLSFGESSIKSRIKGVLKAKKPALPITAAALLVVVIASVCLLTNAKSSAEIKMEAGTAYTLFCDGTEATPEPGLLTELCDAVNAAQKKKLDVSKLTDITVIGSIGGFSDKKLSAGVGLCEGVGSDGEKVYFFRTPETDGSRAYEMSEQDWSSVTAAFAERANCSFRAVVSEVLDGMMYIVVPDAGEEELRSSDKIFVTTELELNVGDHVEVVRTGLIMETYPAQINTVSVTLLDNMPFDFEDYDKDFYTGVDERISVIPSSLSDKLDAERYDLWCKTMPDNSVKVTQMRSLYSLMLDFDIPDDDIRAALVEQRAFCIENNLTTPYATDEDIEILLSRDGRAVAAQFVNEASIVVEDRIYTPLWVYSHSVESYRSEGITPRQIVEKLPIYSVFPYDDVARRDFERRLSEFTGMEVDFDNPAEEYAVTEEQLIGELTPSAEESGTDDGMTTYEILCGVNEEVYIGDGTSRVNYQTDRRKNVRIRISMPSDWTINGTVGNSDEGKVFEMSYAVKNAGMSGRIPAESYLIDDAHGYEIVMLESREDYDGDGKIKAYYHTQFVNSKIDSYYYTVDAGGYYSTMRFSGIGGEPLIPVGLMELIAGSAEVSEVINVEVTETTLVTTAPPPPTDEPQETTAPPPPAEEPQETTAVKQYPSLAPLGKAAERKLCEDYLKYCSDINMLGYTPKLEDIRVLGYYGSYSGCELVIMQAEKPAEVSTGAIGTVPIGSRGIMLNNSCKLHNGSDFMDLKTAYEKGYLTEGDVEAIYFYSVEAGIIEPVIITDETSTVSSEMSSEEIEEFIGYYLTSHDNSFSTRYYLNELTKIQERNIIDDFLAQAKDILGYTPARRNVSIVRNLGTYSGCELVAIDVNDKETESRSFAAREYTYDIPADVLLLRKNSSFYDINTAYEKGYLTRRNLDEAYYHLCSYGAPEEDPSEVESEIPLDGTDRRIDKLDGVMYLIDEDGNAAGSYSGLTRKKLFAEMVFGYKDGVRLSGLQTINNKQYFFDEKRGTAVYGYVTIDGELWLFGKDFVFTGRKEKLPAELSTDRKSYNTRRDNGIKLTLKNAADFSMTYSEHPAVLQEKTQDGWRDIDGGYRASTLTSFILPDKSYETELVFSLPEYKNLRNGIYRVRFSLGGSTNETDIPCYMECYSAEFRITI